MSQQISLKEAERRAFRMSYNDGLWDIMLGCFVSMLAIAPLLSVRLGDWWSSAVFLPVWAFVYVVIRLLRKHVIAPRLGVARFGQARQAKLKKFSVVMLAVNIAAFILGLVAAANIGRIPGQMTSIIFGLLNLLVFSIAAYFLDFNRLYLYGLLAALAPPVGEWLYTYHNATHHGFPITFGATAGIMVLVGLVVFARLLHDNPLPVEGIPGEEV